MVGSTASAGRRAVLQHSLRLCLQGCARCGDLALHWSAPADCERLAMGLDRRLAGSRSGKSGCRLLISGRDAPRFGWWVAARECTKVGDDLHFSYRSDKTALGRACRKGLLRRGIRVFGRPLFILHGTQAQRRENARAPKERPHHILFAACKDAHVAEIWRSIGPQADCERLAMGLDRRLAGSRPGKSGCRLLISGRDAPRFGWWVAARECTKVGDDLHFSYRSDKTALGRACRKGLLRRGIRVFGRPLFILHGTQAQRRENDSCRTWGRVPFRPPMQVV